MLSHYLRLAVFALGLLLGVQVPGFVDQYAKRVSAHEIEAVRALAGFQETANTYFDGSVEALIAHHAASSDAAFQDEARTVRRLYARVTELKAELAALSGPLVMRVLHVAFRPDREILAETRAEYSYTVPLEPAAIASGIIGGLLFAALVDVVIALIGLMVTPHVYRRQRAR